MRNDDLIKKPLYKTKNTCFSYLKYEIEEVIKFYDYCNI